jgi:hypothetical protein
MKRRGEIFGSGGWRVGSIGQVRYCTSVAVVGSYGMRTFMPQAYIKAAVFFHMRARDVT